MTVSNLDSSEEAATCAMGKPACLSLTCFLKVEKLGEEKLQ